MAPIGYISHAHHNRRMLWWLIAAYVLAFELIGAFAITFFLLAFDLEHTILSDPRGYAVRYAVPVAIIAGVQFWFLYRRHAVAVIRSLGIRLPSRVEEPRLWSIAEEQCTALGVRQPQFGIIETPARNALTVGDGPARGLIAVTRGLLDSLDDDELAAVLAHEASHIRNGDTKVLAANHALMRTAVILQVHNPFRLENWRQMFLVILLPPMLLILFVGGAVTMTSMRLARAARRGLRLSRDHIADGEAIRVTHFPEALVTALRKISGHGAIPRAERFEGLMFEGRADHEGGSHPSVEHRIDAITTLGRELMQPGRPRRDTRTGSVPAPTFGRRTAMESLRSMVATAPIVQPDDPSLRMLLMFFTDREGFWKWQNACIDWCEWRESDRRNAFGIAPKMILPLVIASAAVLTLNWPSNGDFSRMWSTFSPTTFVDFMRQANKGPFCSGPSYPDGKCPGTDRANEAGAARPPVAKPNRTQASVAATPLTQSEINAHRRWMRIQGLFGMLLFCFIVFSFFNPRPLLFLLGAKPINKAPKARPDPDPAWGAHLDGRLPSAPATSTARPRYMDPAPPLRFGRRGLE